MELQPLQKSGTCAAYIIYAICFCAALILRTCEPHSAYVQNVRHKQNIGHMRKMCAGGIHCNMCAVCAQSSRYVQNMRSLRTILKICAQYVQFAHIKKKKKSSAPVAGHPSKHWAGPMIEYRCFQCGMVSDTYSYSRRPFICAATLPKVSVLIVCNGKWKL